MLEINAESGISGGGSGVSVGGKGVGVMVAVGSGWNGVRVTVKVGDGFNVAVSVGAARVGVENNPNCCEFTPAKITSIGSNEKDCWLQAEQVSNKTNEMR